ncbi:hypothetical protein D9M72_614130 [compost metagenome]
MVVRCSSGSSLSRKLSQAHSSLLAFTEPLAVRTVMRSPYCTSSAGLYSKIFTPWLASALASPSSRFSECTWPPPMCSRAPP